MNFPSAPYGVVTMPNQPLVITISNVFVNQQGLNNAIWQVQAWDSNFNPITSYNSSAISVTTVSPQVQMVPLKFLTQSTNALGQQATYAISYQVVSPMSPGAAFGIQYPNSVQVPASISCSVVYQSVVYQMQNCIVNSTSNSIAISGGFNQAVNPGDTLVLSFGPVVNPVTQQNAGTFRFESFSDSSFTFPLDAGFDSLSPNFDCPYPCNTCMSSYTSFCTSCQTQNPTETRVFFSPDYGTCNKTCIAGTYNIAGT